MNIRFLTGNAGKVAELQGMLEPLGWSVQADGRGYPELQADTLEEVARAGGQFLLESGLQGPFVLEDSGLVIPSLGGFPGVYSRFALDSFGCDGILRLLAGKSGDARDAYFETALLWVDADNHLHVFSGRCEGRISHQEVGQGGFGFDPIFVATGETRTFGQMSKEEKAKLSHRGKAVSAFVSAIRGAC